jgi:hypothetical protein
MQEVGSRMFEMFPQNKLKADSDTSRSYARFIGVLKQVDEQLPADAPVRRDRAPDQRRMRPDQGRPGGNIPRELIQTMA